VRLGRKAILVAAFAWVSLWAWARCGSVRSASADESSDRVELGRSIFFDGALSEPRGTSCASCHEPARAFAGDHGSGVGVPSGSRPGVLARRATPSLLYLAYVPHFRFYQPDDERGGRVEPYGGFFWDGRSDSIASLVRQPMLNPREMNNRDLAQIADKVRRAPYAAAFRRAFPDALDDPERAAQAIGVALGAFLTSPAMAPFSSRYDDYIRGKVTLTPQEEHGLRLFKDRQRGNCAKCHTLVDTSPSPERSMFTDYGYEAVGAPRNRSLHAPDEDLGLCERADDVTHSSDGHLCASFRTPSLRNVALRKGFMHNGAFTNLRDVVKFYATRATNPEKWYAGGVAFDDTPPRYRGLIDVSVVPYDRRPGDAPAFDDAEIDAIVAFLRTLTDRNTDSLGRLAARAPAL
jgi:cytochrome c peroxidase